MTYAHALRYLSTPLSHSAPSADCPELAALLEELGPAPLFICLSCDKVGRLAARMLRNILHRAGICCLHWSEDESLSPKQRYWLDNAPLSPTLTAACAGSVHKAELAVKHHSDALPSAALCRAAALLLCAAKSECRVVLLETPTVSPLYAHICALRPGVDAIRLLSDKHRVEWDALYDHIRLVITPAYGPELFRRTSDACARRGIRLTTLKKARRSEITLGSQIFGYGELPDCRLGAGAISAATAAQLAAECALSLTQFQLPVAEEHIHTGLSETPLPHTLTPLCISPLILSDVVTAPHELAATLAAWVELPREALPAPHRLCVEQALFDAAALPPEALAPFSQIRVEAHPIAPLEDGVTLLVGSLAFLEEIHQRK